MVELLATSEARPVGVAREQDDAKAVLREIATVLAAPTPIVSVAAVSYKRDVVEADALSVLRQYEEREQRLRDLAARCAELEDARARVDAYIARAEEVLGARDNLVSRLDERAEYLNLLREVGELLSADPAGFELRVERVETLLAPFAAVPRDNSASGVGSHAASARDL